MHRDERCISLDVYLICTHIAVHTQMYLYFYIYIYIHIWLLLHFWGQPKTTTQVRGKDAWWLESRNIDDRFLFVMPFIYSMLALSQPYADFVHNALWRRLDNLKPSLQSQLDSLSALFMAFQRKFPHFPYITGHDSHRLDTFHFRWLCGRVCVYRDLSPLAQALARHLADRDWWGAHLLVMFWKGFSLPPAWFKHLQTPCIRYFYRFL